MKWLTFIGLLLLISCGGPIHLVDESPYEAQLYSETSPEKITQPKHIQKKGDQPQQVTDVITKDTKDVSPPPPAPRKPPAKPATPPPPAPMEKPMLTQTPPSHPAYVNDLHKAALGEQGAKIRHRIPPPAPKKTGYKPVDVVVVVDASHSMGPFLRGVPKTFKGFVPTLEPLDWQMMFTNADYGDRWFLTNIGADNGRAMWLEDDGKLMRDTKYLNKGVPNYPSVFLDTLRPHKYLEYTRPAGDSDQEISQCHLAPGCHSMSANEQPLKALKATFTANRSFFRPQVTDVIAIVFSDSDEGEKHQDDTKRTKAKEVLSAFKQQWPNKNLTVHTIIMVPGADKECVEKYSSGFYPGEGLFGTELAKMADLTNGENFSLCDKSYVPLARKMLADLSNAKE